MANNLIIRHPVRRVHTPNLNCAGGDWCRGIVACCRIMIRFHIHSQVRKACITVVYDHQFGLKRAELPCNKDKDGGLHVCRISIKVVVTFWPVTGVRVG